LIVSFHSLKIIYRQVDYNGFNCRVCSDRRIRGERERERRKNKINL